MRRALLEYQPLLAAIYGLMPWDLDQLEPDEVDQFREDLERRADAVRDAHR